MKAILIVIGILITFQSFSKDKPNIILFLVDDLGYYDLSCTGSNFYETPNVDKLASSGIQFANAYVSHPRCTPSRYAIQTGKYPARVGIPGRPEHMELGETTVAEVLQKSGYTTFFAGKWHLGETETHWPQNQGYDINVGGCSAGAPPSYFYPYNAALADSKQDRKIVGLEKGVKGEYITDRLTDETLKFIRSHKNKPFFAVLAHYAVHTPLQAKMEKISKYEKKLESMNFEGPEYIMKDGNTKMRQDNAIYAAMIESMDESLGKLVNALKQEKLYENTVIVFTSDHGGLSNRGAKNKRPLATSNLPLRAGKGHLYEGGVKFPFIVYYPGVVRPGKTTNQLTINTDIFPTLLDIAAIPLQPQNHIDGVSMLSAMKGGKPFERKLLWHSPVGRPESTGDENASAIRIGDYKLIDYYDAQKMELYDLSADPYETTNLMTTEKELGISLHKKLETWKKDINAFLKR
jgi:arylsulfatase A-like enzyme